MTPLRSYPIVLAVFFSAAVAACTCGETGVIDTVDEPAGDPCAAAAIPSISCADDGVCAAYDDHTACKTTKDQNGNKIEASKCCVRVPRTCKADGDCCPGQVCTSEGRCVDKFDECASDAECGEDGDRFCLPWEDPLGTTNRCTYKKCVDLGQCPAGQSCFAGFCVVQPPCKGACPANSVCVPQNNRCWDYGSGNPPRCQVTCMPGFMAVLKNPENVYDTCKLADIGCDCAELPPLISTDLGRHAAIVASGGKVTVSHFDGVYGDLVVTDFDAAGKAIKSTWVDGVPATGTIVGGPSGARGGIQEPGDVVGKYTDIAQGADGTVYVSYYDETNGNLKFIERDPSGKWGAPHVVDGDPIGGAATGPDTGLYTSLVLDPSGNPSIAYFQRAGATGSPACAQASGAPARLVTAVRYAHATSMHPASAADWTLETASCGARPPPPCDTCETPSSTSVCTVPTTGGTQCSTPSTACPAACASGEVCVIDGGSARCLKQGSAVELADIPPGTGLFPSLAYKGTTPVIAFYDHTKGNLVVASKGASSWTRTTLDGESGGNDTGDVGLFPSLVIDQSGKYNLAYHDFTRRGLRWYSNSSLTAVSNQTSPAPTSFIDTGLFDPAKDGPSWVGADASLLLSASGTFVAYQNSTAIDLRVAKRETTGTWTNIKDVTSGAVGFFADIAEDGGNLYVVHARIHAKTVAGKPTPDDALLLEVLPAQ